MRPRLFAAAAIAVSLIADIVLKRLFLSAPWDGKVLIPGLLDTHYAWNHGISFSLFAQNSTLGGILLTLLLLGVIVFFAVSSFRSTRPVEAAGLGLIVGGALGNIVDRVAHGAVFDFLAVHVGSRPLFVCNTADIFISLGVLGLAAGMLLANRSGTQSS